MNLNKRSIYYVSLYSLDYPILLTKEKKSYDTINKMVVNFAVSINLIKNESFYFVVL